MKRNKGIVAGLLACLVVFSGMVRAEKPKIELKLTGGLGSITGGDANTYLEKYRDFMVRMASENSLAQQGTFQPVRTGMDWQGELLLKLNKKFSLGIGTGFMQVQRSDEQIITVLKGIDDADMSLASANNGTPRRTDRLKYNLNAIPLTFSLYYHMPLSGKLQLSFLGGTGYWFARWNQTINRVDENVYHGGDRYAYESVYATRGGNFELHGGLTLTWNLMKNFALVLEGMGRYLTIRRFTGTETCTYDPPLCKTDCLPLQGTHGTLYYSEIGGIPQMTVSETTPDWPNARKARIDFSGFSLRAGIRISL